MIDKIHEKELLDLAVGLGSIAAPSGHEQPVADYVDGADQDSQTTSAKYVTPFVRGFCPLLGV